MGLTKEEKKAIKLYKKGDKVGKIIKECYLSYGVFYRILNENNVPLREPQLTQKQKKEIIQRYKNGETGTQLEREYKCSRQSIYELLKRSNTPIRHQKTYPVNEGYFDKINHQNKAYLLGFWAADGFRIKNSVGISLTERDKDILIKMREILSTSERPFARGKNDKCLTLRIGNEHLAKRLDELGIVERKTFSVRAPLKEIKSYNRHYIRGVLDGDGWITQRKDKQWRIGIVSGSSDFIDDLCWIIEGELKIKPLTYQRGNVRDLIIGRKDDIYKFLNWIYEDAELFLKRKYKKYQEFLDWY
jgi:intein-encoded DNA endonuclease-like protein